MKVRPEEAEDRAAVYAVNAAAFNTTAEADLVEVLRERARPRVSLVAETDDGTVVGHILFTPVTLFEHPERKLMGLAPMAVAPDYQGRGIGSALVKAGLARCRELGVGAVVVLGHPGYYPRFGFVPAARYGLGCQFDSPGDAFMVVELFPGFLEGLGGLVLFHEAFRRA